MPETCKEPGRVVPSVDLNRCEAKNDCVRVCPYHVFEVRKLTPDEKSSLSFFGSLKSWAHGGKAAFVTAPQDCHACGLCVSACPEKAIRLVPLKTAD